MKKKVYKKPKLISFGKMGLLTEAKNFVGCDTPGGTRQKPNDGIAASLCG